MPIMPAAGLSHSPMLVVAHIRLGKSQCGVAMSAPGSVVYLVLLIHRDWGGDMNGLNTGDRTQTQQKGTRVLESFRDLQRASEREGKSSSQQHCSYFAC